MKNNIRKSTIKRTRRSVSDTVWGMVYDSLDKMLIHLRSPVHKFRSEDQAARAQVLDEVYATIGSRVSDTVFEALVNEAER